MNPFLDRRRFLTGAALLPLAAGAGRGLTPRAAAGEAFPVKRTGGPRLKLSLNAYSFNRPLTAHLRGEPDGMSLFDLLEYCARQDFDAIDPTGYYFPGYPEAPERSYINRFKRRAFQLGLDISGTGVRNNFASPDREARAADVRRIKRWVEVAAEMGAPVLRVFAGSQPDGHSWDDVAAWIADELRLCAEYAEKYGVLIGVQNHGGMLKSAEEMLKLVGMVRSDWLGFVIDTGSFAGPDPYADMARMIPYGVSWQLKELLHGQDGVRTDLKKVIQLMRDAGYRGYVPIETLARRGLTEPHLRVPDFLKEVRQAIAATG